MGKNKIMNDPPVLSEDEIALGELMLFNDSPKAEVANLKKVDKVNLLNFADISKEMVYSISDLSKMAQKIYYIAISNIGKDDDAFHPYTFFVKDIAKTLNIKSKDIYQTVAKATHELSNAKAIFWDSANDHLKTINIFYSADYYFKEGKMSLEFSEQVKQHLLKLQNDFYKVPLKYLLLLPSPNAMRIFNILYGQYYLDNYRRKIKKDITIEMSVRKLCAMFEYDYYINKITTGKFDENKKNYPTLRDFNRYILKPSLDAINNSGLLNITILKKIKGKKDKDCNINYEVNPRKVSHLVFNIGAGQKLEQLEQDRQNIKADDALLKEICEYFKTRFDISNVIVKNLLKTGYSYEKLMLSAIAMQSILNFSSRGIWIYTKDKDNDPNWKNVKSREQTYIKEYLKISLPNLGAFFDNEENFHQLVIKKPVGFLKKTLKEELYLFTIDLINKQSTLASITSNTNEKLCTASLYDNVEYGEKFKNYIKRYDTNKSAKEMGEEFDLIHKIFSFFCRDSALKLNPNTKWKDYFYSGLNEIDIYWKTKFYKQKPERQESIKKTVNRILTERNLL